MMRRHIALFLVILLAFCTGGCGQEHQPLSSTVPPASGSAVGTQSAAVPSAATTPSAAKPTETTQAAPSANPDANRVVSVAGGYDFSLFVTADGRLYECGDYEKNILGAKDYVQDIEKLKVLETNVRDCYTGNGCCAFVKTDGSLYLWGTNDGFWKEAQVTPLKILDGVQSIVLGNNFLLAIKQDGSLWAMGDNTYGQLGTGNTKKAPAPVQVMKDVKKVCAGIGFSLILKNDGSLLCCGDNFFKQFGDVSNTKMPYIEFGKDSGVKFDVQTVPAVLMKGIADIAVGSSHIMALDTSGGVWCAGNNSSGQIGDNYGANTVVSYVTMNIYRRCVKLTKVMDGAAKVYAANNTSFAVKKDNSLWAWGENSSGELGDGSFASSLKPVRVSSEGFTFISPGVSHTLAIGKDGSLWGWGDNSSGQLCNGTTTVYNDYIPVADHVIEAASSGKTTMFLKDDGSLFGCGYNNYSQLADGTIHSASTPRLIMKDVLHIAVGMCASYCIKKDGTLWAWGNNGYGDVGNGRQADINHTFSYDFYKRIDNNHTVPAGYKKFLATPVVNYAPVQILSGMAQVAADGSSGLAVAADGTLYGWGSGDVNFAFGGKSGSYGCLASPIKITGGVKKILDSDMLVKTNGDLMDWGKNILSNRADFKVFKDPFTGAVSATDGYDWRMAVKGDGTLWLWGSVGILNKQTFAKPVQIDDHVRSVSGGNSGLMLIKDDNTLYRILSIDIEDLMAAYAPGKKLTEGQYVRKTMDDVQVAFSVNSMDVGANGSAEFVIKTDGTLLASGSNAFGQLGVGNGSFTPTEIKLKLGGE